jgi:hypothetical protein
VPPPPPKPRRSEALLAALLILGSVVFCLLAAEIAGRSIATRASLWSFPNYIEEYRSLFGRGVPMQFDAGLGHVPRANYKGTDNLEGVMFTFDANSLRLHHYDRPPPKVETPSILVVGDSFAEGGEVEDNSSLPAHLQLLLDRRVHNAAVGGYGLDQIVLRAERDTPRLKPGIVLVSFIPDDITRTQLRVRSGAAKPYFTIENDALVLKGVPVPPPRPDLNKLDPVRKVLGYSYLVDFLMRRTNNLAYWYGGESGDTIAHQDGERVSCRLMDRLKDLRAKTGARIIVVAQYAPQTWTVPEFAARELKMAQNQLACARERGLETIDTADAVRQAVASSSLAAIYINAHMTSHGNKVTAEVIADYLGRNPG